MHNILIVIGSARKGRVADQVLKHVQAKIKDHKDFTSSVADLKEINLPYFDNELAPLHDGYVATDPRVLTWSKMVADADSVLFITPEYNTTLSGLQKNAIDSLGKEWIDKPISAITYGWGGGALVAAALSVIMKHVKADVKDSFGSLQFMKDITTDGAIVDPANVDKQIDTALSELI